MREMVLQFLRRLSQQNKEEEYKAWDKQAKIIKKKEYKKPMPALAEREQCQYEKIRDSIIKERLEAMRESGLFDNFDEMKERIYKEKLIVEQKSSYSF